VDSDAEENARLEAEEQERRQREEEEAEKEARRRANRRPASAPTRTPSPPRVRVPPAEVLPTPRGPLSRVLVSLHATTDLLLFQHLDTDTLADSCRQSVVQSGPLHPPPPEPPAHSKFANAAE